MIEAAPNIGPAEQSYILRVLGLYKCYGALSVLDGIDLKVATGEVISLIGASGSGKSTLLRCINFLETPTSGSIEMFGETISVTSSDQGVPSIANARNITRFRQATGMVFQAFNLWPHRTVLENVTEALIWVKKMARRDAVARALEVLEKVGMAAKRNDYPAHLSGGQQQRVAIARMLATQPKIMLFDEPTSALDPELVAEVLRVIRALAEEGSTILLVTHEMRFAQDVSSRVLFLSAGHIKEDDTPQEIFNRPKSAQLRRFLDASMHA